MSRLRLVDCRIGRRARTGVSKHRISPGVRGIAIVGVNDVARRASAGAIIAGMIVRAGQRHHRVNETRLLQTKKDGIGTQLGAKAAIAQLGVRFAGLLVARWIPKFGFFLATAFEYAKYIAGLRSFPAIERCEFPQNAFRALFFRGWRRKRLDGLWPAFAVVTFAKTGIFCWDRAIVVERCSPQEASVRHHAGGDSARFVRVASNGTTSFRRDA